MHKPVKYVEKAFTYGAKGAWAVFDKLNSRSLHYASLRSGVDVANK